jgi:membrane protein YqaA with SNARE-associated domain
MLSAIQAWASELGGVGLFVIAALDSSFLSFPQVNDLLIIYLSTRYPERMPFYAGMTTAGSLLGCFLLYAVARKGGEVFLRKRFSAARVDRGMALYQRFGLLAVVVPSLLPPPTPFKIFVLMAGAAAVSPWRFGLAIVIGRGIRYFGQGYLAVRYGERAVEMVKANGTAAGIGLAVLALAIGLIYYLVKRQRSQPRRSGKSPGSNG